MKRKQLLQLIKTKAQKIEVKDFSESILDRVRLLPQEEIVTVPKRKFSLKPVFAYSLSVMTVVLAFFIFYSPASPIIPTISDVNQVIALSAVSAASLVDYSDEIIASNDEISLSSGYFTLDVPTDDSVIDTEIDAVSRYLQMMERLLNSSDNFDYQIVLEDPNGFTHHLSFKTTDLLDIETNYAFNYNKVDDLSNNSYALNGELIIESKSYSVSGQGDLDQPRNIELTIASNYANYATVKYEIGDDVNRYQINITENNVKIQTANLAVREVNGQKLAYLDFIGDTSPSGSYAFQIENVNQMRRMIIAYYIAGSTSESGQIDVTIDETPSGPVYAMTVTPKGQTPYIVERGRGTSNSNQNPGRNNTGFGF
ncbi:MAG: hypothetical protein JXC31_01270 [Acholeplasmataceae bacterium]|nr:hypothetical protein [Acholeplasmataceae bacterium]